MITVNNINMNLSSEELSVMKELIEKHMTFMKENNMFYTQPDKYITISALHAKLGALYELSGSSSSTTISGSTIITNNQPQVTTRLLQQSTSGPIFDSFTKGKIADISGYSTQDVTKQQVNSELEKQFEKEMTTNSNNISEKTIYQH